MKKYLSDYTELVKQFHPTKNGNFKPQDFTFGSSKKVWWQCIKEQSHEWEAQIKNRSRGNRCPFCSGQRPSPSQLKLF